jgi:beta-glucanase (GH16 family)
MIIIMIKFKFFSYLMMTMFLASCGEEEKQDQVLLPSNLQVSVAKKERGAVQASFQAVNANFYRVNFGLPNSTAERATGNSASFNYREPGTYTITVQAHATEADFISSSASVTISNEDLGIGIPNDGFESPLAYEGYNLVWQDEFNGNSLSSDWVFELGDGCPDLCGWGNNELQTYRRENTEVKDGFITIKALQESFGGKNYTSSRIKTQGKKSFTFGRFDIRAVLPKGQGLWPAIWMLGDNIPQVGWPACGEIDIMEMVGGSASGRDNTVHGTVHWDNNGQYANFGGSVTLPQGIFNDKFHVFSVIWDENKIVWLLDNVPYHQIDTRPQALDEFRKPHFFLFNVAVGGNWPGSPDSSTSFPQQMVVDYIRVFQRN